MQNSGTIIFSVLIAAAVFLVIQGLYLTFFGKSITHDRKINRRLALLDKGASREQVLEQLRKEMDQHFKARAIPFYSLLATKAQRANLTMAPHMLVLLMAGMSVLCFMGLTFGTQAQLGVRLLASLVLGVGAVYAWVNHKAKTRMALLEEQLPDAVELLVRSLRVGHPFSSAIGILAREIPDPLGTEFGIIADEAAYGRDISEALKALAERMDMQDLRFLAVAVSIQQQSGGNLAEVLDGLAKVIRARFKLFRRVKAITAEAKWSGIFLSAFPIVAMVAIQLIKPDYYDEVKQTAYFTPTALIVGAFLIINVIYMKIMVNIKV